MRRTSHQHGSLKLADRRKGKVWEFRWREVQADGTEDLWTEEVFLDDIRSSVNASLHTFFPVSCFDRSKATRSRSKPDWRI